MRTLHRKPQPQHRPEHVPFIIGLAGLKSSGKDTVAAFLVEDHGFRRESFAAPMKLSSAEALGTTVEVLEALKNNPNAKVQVVVESEFFRDRQVFSSITVREHWQRYGTESHRLIPEFGEDVWTKMMLPKLHGKIAISDARFENEQRALKSAGGFIVVVDRPGMDVGDSHASEIVEHGMTDFWIPNDGDLEDLRKGTEIMVAHLRERRSAGPLGL